MIVDRLEDTLNGGFAGLYGEVVTDDVYNLKTLEWAPDVIFDIGANVGVFTRHARSVFPDALVVSVEPDYENFTHLKKFTEVDDKMTFIRGALGSGGQVFHQRGALNGAHEVYFTTGLGYAEDEVLEGVGEDGIFDESEVSSWTLPQIISPFLKDGRKYLLKLDCEGGENSIWSDEAGMDLVRAMDYIVIELHNHALHGGHREEVISETRAALQTLEATHDCHLEHVNYYAMRKDI